MISSLPYIPSMHLHRRRCQIAFIKQLRETVTRIFRAWQSWTSTRVTAYGPLRASASDVIYSGLHNYLQGLFHGWKRVIRESYLPGALLKLKRTAAVADFLTRYMVKVSYAKRVSNIEEPVPSATLSKRGWESLMMRFRKAVHFEWSRRNTPIKN